MRKVDNEILENNRDSRESDEVHVEFSRATVDVTSMAFKYNFWERPAKTVSRGRWFYIDSEVPDGPQPLSPEDDEMVETAFEHFNRFVGNGGMPPTDLAQFERRLRCKYIGIPQKAVVVRGKTGFEMKLRPTGVSSMFYPDLPLQRGYGDYVVDGEKEEILLNDSGVASSICFVVHGIGELVWSTCKSKSLTPSLIDQVDRMRIDVHKRQIEDWSRRRKEAEDRRKTNPKVELPAAPSRIEMLPVVWFDCWHVNSHTKRSLTSITLPSIAFVRTIANDILLDSLMYLHSIHRDAVLKSVTKQINDKFYSYAKMNPSFSGKFSLVGHSLGSVIVWDVLCRQCKEEEKDFAKFLSTESPPSPDHPSPSLEAQSPEPPVWGPDHSSKCVQEDFLPLPGKPGSVFFLGSPCGLFLTLRGAHEAMSANASFNIMGETTTLVNIFHPSDPVAYRIEPLLLPPDTPAEDIPAPVVLPTVEKGFGTVGGVRAHVRARQSVNAASKKAKQVGKMASDMFATFAKTVGASKEERSFASASASASGAAPGQSQDVQDMADSEEASFSLAGKKNSRVDYQIQGNLLDNELIKSVTAHTGYAKNEDVVAFITRTIYDEGVNFIDS